MACARAASVAAPRRGRRAVRLGCHGQVRGRLRERVAALRQSDELDDACAGDGQLERARVGVADVLAGEDRDPARDVDGVLAALEHHGEVEERGVGIARAHALDERRDGVVVVVAVAVVAHGPPQHGGGHVLLADGSFAARGRVLVRQLERRERVARVTRGGLGDRGQHLALDRRIAERRRSALEHGQQVCLGMALELVQPAAGDERADDRVERILRRGADQRHEARLDDREQRVLLRLVEAVDLVDEQHGAATLGAQALSRAADHGLHVRLARRDRGELFEVGLRARRDDARERRLAGAGRAEEDRRGDAVLLDRAAQGRAWPDQLGLAGEFVERARAQAVGQRRVRCAPLLGRVVEQAHGRTVAFGRCTNCSPERSGTTCSTRSSSSRVN